MSATTTGFDKGVLTVLEAVKQHRDNLPAYKELGLIYAKQQNDLLLFNYTPECQYKGDWNAVERVCRGLIVRWDTPEPELVALPFSKFFGLNEVEETRLENLPLDLSRAEITSKLDGSLGIMYFDKLEDRFRIATRGSFNSSQALWATEWLHRYFWDTLDDPVARGILQKYTFLFEIIYPENQIVVDYGGRSGLFLIGMRFLTDGKDLPYTSLLEFSNQLDIPITGIFHHSNLNDFLNYADSKDHHGIEGWVIRFPDGLRLKVKTEEYRELHKLIDGLTPNRIREALITLTFPKFEKAVVSSLPEKLRKPARKLALEILDRAKAQEEVIKTALTDYQDLITEQKRIKAEFSKRANQLHPQIKSQLIDLLNAKSVFNRVLGDLDLTDLKPVQPEATE